MNDISLNDSTNLLSNLIFQDMDNIKITNGIFSNLNTTVF